MKKHKEIQTIKEEIKVSIFSNNMIIYIKPQKFQWELLQLTNTFKKVAGHKISSQNSVYLLYKDEKLTKKEIRQTIPFTIVSKNKKSVG